MAKRKLPDLRSCASCEYVFRQSLFRDFNCPICNFASYAAITVYGKSAYRYEKSQKPYKERFLSKRQCQANQELNDSLKAAETKRRGITAKALNIVMPSN